MQFASFLLTVLVSIVAARPSTLKYRQYGPSSITATDIIHIAPSTATCSSTNEFPAECRNATQAAPLVAASFVQYNVSDFASQAALVALMLYESGNFTYNQNHFPAPGVPGQGTRNMQSPAFNKLYALSIPALAPLVPGVEASQGPAGILDLVGQDQYSFASAAWFLTSQCTPSVRQQLATANETGFAAYIQECVGTTLTPERTAVWHSVVALGYW